MNKFVNALKYENLHYSLKDRYLRNSMPILYSIACSRVEYIKSGIHPHGDPKDGEGPR